MKKNMVKKVLFTLTGALAWPGLGEASSKHEVYLLEDLPIEQRVIVHAQVSKFLKLNPGSLTETQVIAVDEQGAVYVLDENEAQLTLIGQPSCIGSTP